MATSTKAVRKKTPTKRYRIAGVTRDGVKILAVGPATHFTDKEIRDTIRLVKRESNAGRIIESRVDGRKS